jgi:hypothetical protein
VLGCRPDDWGFESQQSLGFFLFTTASRLALRPTQPPIQWVLGALSLGVKWHWCEADHSPPSSVKAKNAWRYTSTPQYTFMVWCLVKYRHFTFTFYCVGCKILTNTYRNSANSSLECNFLFLITLQGNPIYQSHPSPGRYLSLYHQRRCQCGTQCDSTAACVVHIWDSLA